MLPNLDVDVEDSVNSIPVHEEPRLMGVGDPHDQVALFTSEFMDAQYDSRSISTLPPPSLPVYPTTPASDAVSSDFWFPVATASQRAPDLRYQTGVSELFPVPPGEKDVRKKALVRAGIHSAFQPEPSIGPDGTAQYDHRLYVPGQRQMVPGVPQVVFEPDRPDYQQTFATLHVPSTLCAIPGNKDIVDRDIRCLLEITYGDPNSSEEVPRMAIFDCDLIPNSRDPGQHASPREGSFSLAFTSGEGEGTGNVQPAKQVRTGKTEQKLSRLLPILARLGKIALRASIKKAEFDTIEARGILNNVPGFGAADNVFFTGIQLNVSSVQSTDLAKAIGGLQGRLHVDIHDCLASWTVVLLLLRLPPGSDPGVFMFPEYGLFVHTVEHVYDDFYVCIIVFKGRHAHGGIAPRGTYTATVLKDIFDKTEGVNRCVYVLYANYPAVGRVGSFGIGLPVGFWVASVIGQRKAGARTMAEDAAKIFVLPELHSQWMFREIGFCTYNSILMTLSRLGLPSDHVRISDHLKHAAYRNGDGTIVPIARLTLDPSLDGDSLQAIQRHRKIYAGMFKIAEHFLLPVRKFDLRKGRSDSLAKDAAGRSAPIWTVNMPLHEIEPDHGPWTICGAQYDPSSLRWLVAIRYNEDTRSLVHWIPEANLLVVGMEPAHASRLADMKRTNSSVVSSAAGVLPPVTGHVGEKRKGTSDDGRPSKHPRTSDESSSSTAQGHAPDRPLSPSNDPDPARADVNDSSLDIRAEQAGHDPYGSRSDLVRPDPPDDSDHDVDQSEQDAESDTHDLPISMTHPVMISLSSELSSISIQSHIDSLVTARAHWQLSVRRASSRNVLGSIDEDYAQYRKLFDQTALAVTSEDDDIDASMGVRCIGLLANMARPLSQMQVSHHCATITAEGAFVRACRFMVVAHEWFSSCGPDLADLVFLALDRDKDVAEPTWLQRFATDIREVVALGRKKTIELLGFPSSSSIALSSNTQARYIIHCPARAKGEKALSENMQSLLERRLFVSELFLIVAGEKVDVACSILGYKCPLPPTPDAPCNAVLTIGLVLKLFCECVGSEGIWTLPGLAHIWINPHILWGYANLRLMAEPYSTTIFRNYPISNPKTKSMHKVTTKTTRLDLGRDKWMLWFRTRLTVDPDLQSKIREHYSLTSTHILELEIGRPLEIVPAAFASNPAQRVRGGPHNTIIRSARRVTQRVTWHRLESKDIVPLGRLNLRIAATLVSHALIRVSDEYPALTDIFKIHSRIHLLLVGRDVSSGRQLDKFTPDQFNVIRASWKSVVFLADAIPASALLTSPVAFCNLLAAIGTGQNSRTYHFLTNVWMPPLPFPAVGRDLPRTGSELASRVQTVMDQNNTIRNEQANLATYEKSVTEAALLRLPHYHAVEDSRVWGVYSADVGFGISRKGDQKRSDVDRLSFDDILTKSTSFFASIIHRRWGTVIAERSSGQPPPTWAEMLQFVKDFKTAPFKGTGLCTFQLTNHLAERGLCELPTATEMAQWICANDMKGAYKGLLVLGFNINNQDTRLAAVALRYLDEHFKQSMPDNIRSDCHHGMIFLENLLCKVSRVDSILCGMVATRDLKESFSACWDGWDSSSPFALDFDPLILNNVLQSQ